MEPRDVLELGDADWDQAVASPLPLAVTFWADWCVPSRSARPQLTEASQALRGRLRLASVNVDQNPRLTALHQIQGLPTLLILHAGKVRERRVGMMQAEPLLRLLQRYSEPESTEVRP